MSEHAKHCKGRARGECHPRAKLSDKDCVLMRFLHREEGVGYTRLGKRFGCARSTAQYICNKTRRIASPEEQVGYE